MDNALPHITPGQVYVPSDDGMSEILHNASHAYTMYLNSPEKDTELSLDGPVSPYLWRRADIEIVQSIELVNNDVSRPISTRKHNLNIYNPLRLLQSDRISFQRRHYGKDSWFLVEWTFDTEIA